MNEEFNIPTEEAEVAQLLSQQANDAAVAAAVAAARAAANVTRPSLVYCKDCDGEIEEARRKAVPGVQYCTECQSYH